MFRIGSLSVVLAAIMAGNALAGDGKAPHGKPDRPGTAATQADGTALRYVYDYKVTYPVTPGSLKEDCGLPESYTERVRGDSRVEAICTEGSAVVVFEKDQLYLRTSVARATGLLLGGGAKDVSYRLPAITEEWFFGDGTVSRTTSGGPAGGPDGQLLLIEAATNADNLLTCRILPPELASRFGIDSSMPSAQGDGTGPRDTSIDCEELMRIEKETDVPGAISYEASVPLSAVMEGTPPEGARWVSDVVQDTASELPISVTSWIAPPTEGAGRPGAGGAEVPQGTVLLQSHDRYEWSEVGGMKLAKFLLSATGSPETVELARSGRSSEEGSLPPPTTIILRLKSALAGEAALREGGVPVLPDTKEIQDNTVSPPHTIK